MLVKIFLITTVERTFDDISLSAICGDIFMFAQSPRNGSAEKSPFYKAWKYVREGLATNVKTISSMAVIPLFEIFPHAVLINIYYTY